MLKFNSYKKGIVFSALFNAAAKILTIALVLIVGYHFGTEKKADIFFFLFALIIVISEFAKNVNRSAIIPKLMQLEAHKGREKSIEFLNTFFYSYLFVALVLISFTFINSNKLLSLTSNFSSATILGNAKAIHFALIFLALRLISVYLSETALSFKCFTVPMISNNITYGCAIIATLLFHGQFGINAVFYGFIAGALLSIFFILCVLKKEIGWKITAKFNIPFEVFKKITYAKLWHFSQLLALYIPIFILTGLGRGILSSINYGRQALDAAIYFVVFQFALIVGIKLNELNVQNKIDELDRIFKKSTKFLIFITMPAAFLVFIYSSEIIAILFKRGVFTQTSVDMCSKFLKYFIFLLPLIAIHTLMSKVNIATGKIKQAAVYETVVNAILIGIIIWAIGRFGAVGYPIAMLVTFTVANTLGFLIYNKIVFPHIKFVLLIKYLLIVFAVNFIMAVGLIKIKPFLWQNPILNLCAGSIIYLIAMTLLNFFTNLNKDFNVQLKNVIKMLR
ncbi:MAG TPA: lipid II flippase MurJ [Elusimicrobiales bacterium]|nr:lipid II flippase MurJ [Elusimicrobiales bacterium]